MSKSEAKNSALLGDRMALACFMNALLREWTQWALRDLPLLLAQRSHCTRGIAFPLRSGKTLWVPVEKESALGRHSYAWPLFLEQETAEAFSELSYKSFVKHLLEGQDLSDLSEEQSLKVFQARVADSAQTMAEVLDQRKGELKLLCRKPMSFREGEQFLIAGHNFHPTPKSHDGFTAEDRRNFCPEYAGQFSLHWFSVHRDRLHKDHSQSFGDHDWIEELWASDPLLRKNLPIEQDADFYLFPAHPWQAQHLLSLPRVKELVEKGWLKDLGRAGELWYPSSSVRSIYRQDAPYMLKLSLSVRLTNSIRELLPHEVVRGLQAHDVFSSPRGQEFSARYPLFQVLYEPAYAALRDEAGELIGESIVVCRSNPFRDKREAVVLASLNQDNIFHEARGSLIGTYVERLSAWTSPAAAALLWFERYCSVVLEPLLMAQADFGFLLGAHQQNLILELSEYLPTRCYFRDCQGTGYSADFYEELKAFVPALNIENGNILPLDKAHILFVYYLLINSTFNVITSIANAGSVTEAELLKALRLFLEGLLAKNPRDPSCIQHLLESESLMHKGNFLCALQSLNENTLSNPLDLYTAIKNPIRLSMGEGVRA